MNGIKKIFILDILSKDLDDEHLINGIMKLNNCTRDVAESKLNQMKKEKEEN